MLRKPKYALDLLISRSIPSLGRWTLRRWWSRRATHPTRRPAGRAAVDQPWFLTGLHDSVRSRVPTVLFRSLPTRRSVLFCGARWRVPLTRNIQSDRPSRPWSSSTPSGALDVSSAAVFFLDNCQRHCHRRRNFGAAFRHPNAAPGSGLACRRQVPVGRNEVPPSAGGRDPLILPLGATSRPRIQRRVAGSDLLE